MAGRRFQRIEQSRRSDQFQYTIGSTGGLTAKRHGRIGDSPIIGAGTFARNATAAVSCTGHGEFRHIVLRLGRSIAASLILAAVKEVHAQDNRPTWEAGSAMIRPTRSRGSWRLPRLRRKMNSG